MAAPIACAGCCSWGSGFVRLQDLGAPVIAAPRPRTPPSPALPPSGRPRRGKRRCEHRARLGERRVNELQPPLECEGPVAAGGHKRVLATVGSRADCLRCRESSLDCSFTRSQDIRPPPNPGRVYLDARGQRALSANTGTKCCCPCVPGRNVLARRGTVSVAEPMRWSTVRVAAQARCPRTVRRVFALPLAPSPSTMR